MKYQVHQKLREKSPSRETKVSRLQKKVGRKINQKPNTSDQTSGIQKVEGKRTGTAQGFNDTQKYMRNADVDQNYHRNGQR